MSNFNGITLSQIFFKTMSKAFVITAIWTLLCLLFVMAQSKVEINLFDLVYRYHPPIIALSLIISAVVFINHPRTAIYTRYILGFIVAFTTMFIVYKMFFTVSIGESNSPMFAKHILLSLVLCFCIMNAYMLNPGVIWPSLLSFLVYFIIKIIFELFSIPILPKFYDIFILSISFLAIVVLEYQKSVNYRVLLVSYNMLGVYVLNWTVNQLLCMPKIFFHKNISQGLWREKIDFIKKISGGLWILDFVVTFSISLILVAIFLTIAKFSYRQYSRYYI